MGLYTKLKIYLNWQSASAHQADKQTSRLSIKPCRSLLVILATSVSIIGCSPSSDTYLCSDARNPYTDEFKSQITDLELVIDYERLTVAKCMLHNGGKVPWCQRMSDPRFIGHLTLFSGTDSVAGYSFDSRTRKLTNIDGALEYRCIDN